MPIYEYSCECGNREDKFFPVADYNKPHRCKCGAWMVKQFSAPMIQGDYQPYNCPITGKWIDGRRAHRENLALHGCRVLETGEREQVEQYRRKTDTALDKAVDATTEEFMATLPPRKVEQLVAEIQGGLTAEIVRS